MANLSKSILLPPYLNNTMWTDLTSAMDQLFLDTETATKQLQGVRNPYVVGPLIQNAIASGVMFDITSSEYQTDLQLLLKQLAFNGLPLNNPSYLSATQALMLFRNIGAYWYSKGTGKIIDFINFTMGASLQMINLWTKDYVSFEPETVYDLKTNSEIPNPVIDLTQTVALGYPDGWYPTTHVNMALGTSSVFKNITADEFLQFFNDVFNYNLVLYSIEIDNTIPVGVANQQNMISIGLFMEVDVYHTGP